MRKDLLFHNQLLKNNCLKTSLEKTTLPFRTILLVLVYNVRHKGIETTTNFAVKNTFALESNILITTIRGATFFLYWYACNMGLSFLFSWFAFLFIV